MTNFLVTHFSTARSITPRKPKPMSPYFLTHKSNTPNLSEVVTNDNQIVTECVDCDHHFPREWLVQVGVMLSLLRKRFVGS